MLRIRALWHRLCRPNCWAGVAGRKANLSSKPIACTTVVVGLSGGVDSSVSALLLKETGYRVVGVFMHNWDEYEERGRGCTARRDRRDVEQVANRLGIEWHEVDFSREYWTHVFSELVAGYNAGRTPNPDVLCNRHVKFHAFFDYAIQRLGADYVATGHYAQLRYSAWCTPDGEPSAELCCAADADKDQTYFLAAVPGTRLQRVLFPVGHLAKSAVRQRAAAAGLCTASKRDSVGLCFVGKRKWADFISAYTTLPPARLVLLEDGRQVAGPPLSSAAYTVGQRAGLPSQPQALYVAAKDPARCLLVPGRAHPALYADRLVLQAPPHWIGAEPSPGPVLCRVRHRQPLRAAELQRTPDGGLEVVFARPVRALAPGQVAALYRDGVCLGGAPIARVGPSLWDRGRRTPVDATEAWE